MYYPRVLIIGQAFDKESGGGITLSNLFSGWDKQKIAVAFNTLQPPDFSICENYYRLGSTEIRHNFPYNYLFEPNTSPSGTITKQPEKGAQGGSTLKTSHRPMLKLKNQLLTSSGQWHRVARLEPGREFTNWVRDFAPEVIYTQLSSLELIRFTSSLASDLKLPYAVHIMDDWPTTITNKQHSIFKLYWNRVFDRELRKLFSQAGIRMSIGESMSEAYQKRYGLSFIPFHNPVDVDYWKPHSKKDYTAASPFRILYTGRIGMANSNSVRFIANVVDELNQDGMKLQLDIYTPDAGMPVSAPLQSLKGVNVMPLLPYATMPTLLPSYDLLLLPLDFDSLGIKFARYSFPTKASEYMISGTPILVFADEKTGLSKAATSGGWGFIENRFDKSALTETITGIMNDQQKREQTGKKAVEFAMLHENAVTIRKKFQDSIARLVQ